MNRVVTPEILDELSVDDPRAVRSRQDLRFINHFMRGEEWILQSLHQSVTLPKRVIELGAGEGKLVNKISRAFPEVQVTALDFIPKPESVDEKVEWVSGDLMEYEGFSEDTVVVANLFIHHLEREGLEKLGHKLSGVQGLYFSEPYRARIPLVMGRSIFPLVNEVTRHDMMVSIKAGFKRGELPEVFGEAFQWTETVGLFGGLRVKGERK